MTVHRSPGQPAPLTFGMLLYPGFTLLDLAGPQTVLGMHGRTLLLWKNLEAVATDSGVSMNPTTTFGDCPGDLDVLFVPGGMGTVAAMKDPEVIEFLDRVGPTARYVTSVCTGSLLLAAAGLLKGYKSATHWAFYDALRASDATAVGERVVSDRNRCSGGGVTAGIDFALTLLAQLRDEPTAKLTQLLMEYDPQPPFDAGTPDTAGPQLTQIARSMMDELNQAAVAIAQRR